MDKKIKSTFISSSLPCTAKDIQSFVSRRPKFMRVVDQFNEDELLPPHLLFRFFKSTKSVKQLKTLNLNWNYLPGIHARPEVVKSVMKRHCQSIQKFDTVVLDQVKSYHFKNLYVPLKRVVTASLDNDKDIKKLLALKTMENLKINVKSESLDYKQLEGVLMRQPNLKNLNIVCLPKSLDRILVILEKLKVKKQEQINFEVSVGGHQNPNQLIRFQAIVNEKIREMNFHLASPNETLKSFLSGQPLIFNTLKSLKLEFTDVNLQTTSYLKHLERFNNLENLTVAFMHCQDKEIAGNIIKNIRIPPSVKKLELNIPLHLSSLLTQTKQLIKKNKVYKRNFPWRNRNIFEEEEAVFGSFFQNFADAKQLHTIAFDFHMLEGFNPHYTNFIISILNRVQNITALEIQVNDHFQDKTINRSTTYFDLAPFFKACSSMPNVEQIDMLMPNLLFKDAEFIPVTKSLKSLTIGVDEREEDNPIKFQDISKSVEKLLKTLSRYAPDLVTLSLDFAEELDQENLVKRFFMIQKFKKLEALGARFFVGKCDPLTTQQIGQVLKSLKQLNMLLLKFFNTDKVIYGIENYVKYHKYIRNILIQFNESTWMDNECLLDPLNCQIKGSVAKIEEEQEEQTGSAIFENGTDEHF